MKFLGKGGMEETATLRSQQGTDQFLSKLLDNNATYRAFVPIIETEPDKWTVAAATVVGRDLVYDALGSSFVLVDYDVDDLGQIKDLSGLDRLSKISRVILEAQYAKEVAREKREAEQTAKDMNQQVDAANLNATLQKLEYKYHGGKVNGQNILPDVKPVVGNLNVAGMTNLLVIKLLPNKEPDNVRPSRAALMLTSTKIKQFKQCLNEITEEDKKRGYIECSYVYEGKDKTEAGRDAAFRYVPQNEWLQTTYPKWFKDNADDIKDRLLYSQEAIAKKNKNTAFSPAVPDIFKAFKAWVQKQTVLPYIDTTQSIVKSAAPYMLEYEVFTNFESLRDELLKLTKDNEEPDEKESDAAVDGKAFQTIAESQDQIAAMEQVGEEVYDRAGGETAAEEEDIPADL